MSTANSSRLSPPRWPAPPSSSSSHSAAAATPGQHGKPHRHRPATAHAEQHVYVLTLRLSPSLHDPLNALRTRYFPSSRLKVAAHLTLFHALPHSQLCEIVEEIQEVAGRTRTFEVKTGGVFMLGKQGVAVSPGKGTEQGAAVHAALRAKWASFLSKQDAKDFKAHWTVQNKVDDEEEVKQTYAEVGKWAKEEGAQGVADGLELWRYDRGHWVPEREFAFEG
ncbi:hypothetical protein JCM11641_004911 [Rhodosporidiobolus odoratus]